jgi:hypothetical protein
MKNCKQLYKTNNKKGKERKDDQNTFSPEIIQSKLIVALALSIKSLKLYESASALKLNPKH